MMSKNDWMKNIERFLAVAFALRGSSRGVSARTRGKNNGKRMSTIPGYWAPFDDSRFNAQLETWRNNLYTSGAQRHLR